METKFNKKETARLLEEYYEKLEDRKVRITISAKIGTFGYYETKGCETKITVSESLEVAGMTKEVKHTLSKEDLTHHTTAILEHNGYAVQSVDLDDGISSRTEGYYMDEHTVERAYCNGIVVRLEKIKEKQYVKTN